MTLLIFVIFIFENIFYKQNRKQNFANWLRQAKDFYNNVLSDNAIITKFATFGMVEGDLQERQQTFADAEALNKK